MDAGWTSVAIGVGSAVVGSAITGAVWYGALKSWMAVREEREREAKEKLTDHEDRIRDLERDVRPLDFAR